MIVIDATNLIIGRLATAVAKMALHGEEIRIVNSENCIISGSKKDVFAKYKRKKDMGKPEKGPFFPKLADRILKRTVRGMLPYKTSRGREAMKNVKCYRGVPISLQEAKPTTFETANVSNSSAIKFIKLGDIAQHLGAKK